MTDFPADVEQQLRNMDEASFGALVAKVRAPDSRENLKTVAAQVLSGPQLDAFVDSADLAKFTGTDGHIDEERVMGRLTALFGQGARPGDGGRAEAAKRFKASHRAQAVPVGPGAAGRAEAQRRFGKREAQQ